MGVSGRAVVIVGVNHGLIGQLSRGEYITSIFSSAAVDPVAVKALQGPGQRKHDRTLRIELQSPWGALRKCDRSSREWAGKKDGSGGLARVQY